MTINLYFTGGGIASILVALFGLLVGAAGVYFAFQTSRAAIKSADAAMKLANKNYQDPYRDPKTGRTYIPGKK